MPFRKDSYGQGHRTPALRLQVEVPPTPAFPARGGPDARTASGTADRFTAFPSSSGL
jgi:hypothetical protein